MQVDVSTEEGKSDMRDVHYINVTMPEVDDNRLRRTEERCERGL